MYSLLHTFFFFFLTFFPHFYLPARDYPWILKNKRPEKLRDTLKEVEVRFGKFQEQQQIIQFSNLFQQL